MKCENCKYFRISRSPYTGLIMHICMRTKKIMTQLGCDYFEPKPPDNNDLKEESVLEDE